MNKILLLFLSLFLITLEISAQTGNVGIGTATPKASAALDITDANRGLLIPRVALTATNAAGPITLPEPSLLVYNTATAGTAPNNVIPGYYYNAGTAASPNWVRLINTGNGKANNGLSVDNDTVKLGGTLIQNTTITQGTNNMVYNLNGTGDFDIQDNGTSAFFVKDDGDVGINNNNPGAKLHIIVPNDNNNNPDGNGIYVYNAGNSGDNDDAIIAARVLGANAGDPFFSLDIEGVTGWSMGIDNSDADRLKFANSWSDPGTNTRMSIATNGEVTINNLAGTGDRIVTANSSGVLQTKDNAIWTLSANFSHSADDWCTGCSSTGGLGDGDDNTSLVDLGFTLRINGIDYTQITVSQNGWIAFGNIGTPASSYANTSLPTALTTNPIIFPYWDDLKDYGTGEAVQWGLVGTSPNRVRIIDFNTRGRNATTYRLRFQVQIHETSGLINVKYRDEMNAAYNGQAATIGFQLDGGSSAKAYPIVLDGKVLDDNRDDSEGWSVCPVR